MATQHTTLEKLHALCPANALSAHYIAQQKGMLKTGSPGAWKLNEGVTLCAQDIDEFIQACMQQGTIEVQHTNMYVVQVDGFRIVYVTKPLANTQEVTIVRNTIVVPLKSYKVANKITERLTKKHGVLIAGAPGHGKSTFVAAVLHELAHNNIIKTIESPRDLLVPKNVVQLNNTHPEQLKDTLLLSRPDVVCFDEIRHKADSTLFADLRLCGIGCFGVIHATKPVDAVARYAQHIGLGELAHTLDTVLFIENGKVKQCLDISLTVKVPQGLKTKDLARPVVVIKDLLTHQELYEVFTFADQVIMHPCTADQDHGHKEVIEALFAKRDIEYTLEDQTVTVTQEHAETAKETIQILGQLGIHLQLEIQKNIVQVTYEPVLSENKVGFRVTSEKPCTITVDGAYVLNGKPSKKGIIAVKADSTEGQRLLGALKSGQPIHVYET